MPRILAGQTCRSPRFRRQNLARAPAGWRLHRQAIDSRHHAGEHRLPKCRPRRRNANVHRPASKCRQRSSSRRCCRRATSHGRLASWSSNRGCQEQHRLERLSPAEIDRLPNFEQGFRSSHRSPNPGRKSPGDQHRFGLSASARSTTFRNRSAFIHPPKWISLSCAIRMPQNAGLSLFSFKRTVSIFIRSGETRRPFRSPKLHKTRLVIAARPPQKSAARYFVVNGHTERSNISSVFAAMMKSFCASLSPHASTIGRSPSPIQERSADDDLPLLAMAATLLVKSNDWA